MLDLNPLSRYRGSANDLELTRSMEKGDFVGHPFRGNQWSNASGSGRGDTGSSPAQDEQAYNMRQQGKSWEAIAKELGYANGGSVRRLAMRHEKLLQDKGGVVPVVKPVVPKPDAVEDSAVDDRKVADSLSIKRARRLLNETFKGDVVTTLANALDTASGFGDKPASAAEAQIVANVTEAGNLMQAAFDAEMAKLSGRDPVYTAQSAKEMDAIIDRQARDGQIGRKVVYDTQQLLGKNFDKTTADLAFFAKELVKENGVVTDERFTDLNSRSQSYIIVNDRSITVPKGIEGDVLRVADTAILVAKQLVSSVIDGKITREELSTALQPANILALTVFDENSVDAGKSRLGGWQTGFETEISTWDPDRKYSVLTLKSREQLLVHSVQKMMASTSVLEKFDLADRVIRPQAARDADRNRVAEIQTLRGSSNTSLSQRQQAVANVLSAFGVKTKKAGSIEISFDRKVSIDGREQIFRDQIDSMMPIMPEAFTRGTNSPRDVRIGSASLKYVIKLGGGRAHAQNLGKDGTLLKVGKPNAQSVGWRSVLLHEMFHGVENSTPAVRHLQFLYWDKRREGEKVKGMRSITGNTSYRGNEKGVKDAWGNQYAGKTYGGRGANSEILTTGVQSVFFGDERADNEHIGFTLALLALSTQLK